MSLENTFIRTSIIRTIGVAPFLFSCPTKQQNPFQVGSVTGLSQNIGFSKEEEEDLQQNIQF
jgi:hypothetical protein